ncbi:hypothetical protein KFK09_022000 [Dendrobium nobile]|uniref:Uncharacterized protein n=1 Tax=Dendrobium nobile TaxID=94219 RepID=A0A8T3AHB1_DENNO|nr:hypothetical protein KFK09_022000 [Dendrobium nobile]
MGEKVVGLSGYKKDLTQDRDAVGGGGEFLQWISGGRTRTALRQIGNCEAAGQRSMMEHLTGERNRKTRTALSEEINGRRRFRARAGQ